MNKYVEYLRNNPKGYWFKAKIYGWGWVPVKWQGWSVILGFVALFAFGEVIFLNLMELGRVGLVHWLVFIFYITVLIIVLIRICYKKGEKPHWQWGLPKK